MSHRPTDWSPLAGSDPVPGDWAQVKELARDLRDIADEIKAQTEKLKHLCSDDYWVSDAADKFDETAKETSKALAKTYERYDAASDALESYWPVLKSEQAETLTLRTRAISLETERDDAQRRVDADDPAAETPRPGAQGDQHVVSDYGRRLRELQSQADECAEAVRRAAKNAADKLHDRAHDDGLRDGWRDKAKNWIHENMSPWLKWVSKIAGILSAICGVLALICMFVPGLQILVPFLAGAALFFTAVSFAANLLLYAAGDGGLGAVLLDAFGLITFGIGSKAIGAVKAGTAAIRASAKLGGAASRGLPAAMRGTPAFRGAVEAVARGNLAKASQLTGIPLRSLKGMIGGKFGTLSHIGIGGFRDSLKALSQAPKLHVPALAGRLHLPGVTGIEARLLDDLGPGLRAALAEVDAVGINTAALARQLAALDEARLTVIVSQVVGTTIDIGQLPRIGFLGGVADAGRNTPY